MQIHPVISSDKLHKAANNPLPGQEQEEQDPIIINKHPEWEVEKIFTSQLYY